MRRGGCQRRAGNLYCIEMKIYRNQSAFRRTALAVCALFCLGLTAAPLVAQAGKEHGGEAQAGGDQAGADKAAADKSAAEKSTPPPLPPDAHVQQSIQLGGKALHYTVTVGALPVRDGEGKVA